MYFRHLPDVLISKVSYIDLAETKGESPVNEKTLQLRKTLRVELGILLKSRKLSAVNVKEHLTSMGQQLSPR